MHVFSSDEYVELIQQLSEEHYDTIETEEPISEEAWIPSESSNKEKMIRHYQDRMVDVTNTSADKLKEQLLIFKYVKIGNFKAMITKNNYLPIKDIKNNLCIEVWEEKYKTPNGFDCKIDYPLHIGNDHRFTGSPWKRSFSGNSANNLSLDIIFGVIRFLQVLYKLPAFI
jgi:hypothetical protein